jgi:RNA polymerase sigma-70 factor, ECF subfamily
MTMYSSKTIDTSVHPISFGIETPNRVNEAFIQYRLAEDAAALRRVDQWTHAFVVQYFAVRCARDRRLGEVVSDELIGRALERIVSRRSTVRRPERYVGWVHTLCRNLLIDAARRRRIVPEALPTGGVAEPVTEESHSVSDSGEGALRAVHSAIGRLPAYQRMAVQLRFVEGLSYTEVAEVTRKNVSTLRVYVQRAVRRLRGELGRQRRT